MVPPQAPWERKQARTLGTCIVDFACESRRCHRQCGTGQPRLLQRDETHLMPPRDGVGASLGSCTVNYCARAKAGLSMVPHSLFEDLLEQRRSALIGARLI